MLTVLSPGTWHDRAVTEELGHTLSGGTPAVLLRASGGPAADEVTAAARAEAERLGWALDEVVPGGDAASEVAALAGRSVETAVVLGGGDAVAELVAAAAEAGWRPTVLALGPLADPTLRRRAEGFGGRLLLAFPTLPGDRTPAGTAALRGALAAREAAASAAPPTALGATEVAAYVALDLLVEGLRRTGRELSRSGLVAALEGLRDHRTGLMPPLSYGPNRRLGTGGAWIVELGAAAPGATTWVELVR